MRQPAAAAVVLVFVLNLVSSALAQQANGEILYNGIVLPSEWPPRPDIFPVYAPIPPYLVSPPSVIPIDVGRELFVDDFLVESTNLNRVHHQPVYSDVSPVLAPDKSWEHGFTIPYSDGIFYDPQERKYKMWYMAGIRESTAYATSVDGISWDKPILDVVPGTNIVLPLNGRDSNTVWLDLFETNPAKRYKMGWWYSRLQFQYSADGIHWGPVEHHSGFTGDRTSFFYNPFRSKWVISVRDGDDSQELIDTRRGGRIKRYAEGATLAEAAGSWPDNSSYDDVNVLPKWLSADMYDVANRHPNFPVQLYQFDAGAYESLMLGFFTILTQDTDPIDPLRPKINEVYVGYSRDGFHFSRPDRSRPFFPVSEDPAAWNYANVQTPAGGVIIVGDEIRFYVTGRRVKSPVQGATDAYVGLAVLRRDGFASMEAGPSEGTLTTRPVTFTGKHLFVNVEAPNGQLCAEVVDQNNQVIAPFSKSNCNPVTADSTIQQLTWNGAPDLSAVSGQSVKLRFFLTNGKLYAFWVSPDSSGASHGYVGAGGPGFTGPRDTVGINGYLAPGPLLTASFAANPSAIAPGGSSTLSWSSANATTVSIDQGIGPVSTGGSRTVNPVTTTTYTLAAQNSTGTVTKQVTVTVAPLPTATLSVTPSVNLGQTATLTWSTTNATSVSIHPGIGPVIANGSQAVTPSGTTTYVLTAGNASGSVTTSATVTVVTPTASAQFIRTDSATQGTWKGAFGSDGYTLASDATALPSYAQVTLGGSSWVWSATTTDVRGLQRATGSTRFAATWYANSFNIDVNVLDTQTHSVALYMVDFDRYARSQAVEVIEIATNTVLDSRTVASMQNGQYLVWEVSGRVRFRITNLNSSTNAVISGVFFDAPGGVAPPPPPPAPTATFDATPVTMAPGGSSTLTWTSANTTSVSIAPGIGAVSANGSHVVTPSATTTYTLTAQNAAGTATKQTTVTVTPQPTASLSVTPTVTAGQPATLTWSTANASSVSINQNIGPVAASGTQTVTPAATTTYVLTASNSQGTVTASSTVTVLPPSTPPSTTAAARFVRTDAGTQGSWKGTFGAEGYAIAADTASLPAYAQVTFPGQPWVWSPATTNVRGLEKATGTSRIAATWYGSSFTIDVSILDGQNHAVALYLLDWDSPSRSQTIEVIDAATNTVLDTRSAAGFQNGLYVVWEVSGSVRFRMTRTGGANAVVGGLFFDSAAPAGTVSNQFLRTDSTTQGTWKGTYGADGYALAADATTLPAFASLNLSGQSNWTWAGNTADPRALQTAAGGGRIAATWYSGSSFLIDLTLTDGQGHAVALYMVDWDSPYRVQTVDLIDAATGVIVASRTVANFQNGVYLVWQVAGSVRFRVTSSAGSNGVVSGVFLGAP